MDGIFKTAMGGFKKSDVLEFIDNQENEFKKNEKALKDKIEELEGKLLEQKKEKDDLLLKMGGLETELELEGKENAEARQQVTSIADQTEAMRNELDRKENINNELKREITIHKQNIEAKNAKIAEKDAEIERLNNTINTISTTQQRISRVMVEAQNTADKIIDTAKEKARCIICETEKKLTIVMQHTEEFSTETEMFHAKIESFTDGVKELTQELSDISESLSGSMKYQETMPAVENAGTAKNAGSLENSGAREVVSQTDERQAETAPEHNCEIKKDSIPGSLFNFSLQRKMFNWDKD